MRLVGRGQQDEVSRIDEIVKYQSEKLFECVIYVINVHKTLIPLCFISPGGSLFRDTCVETTYLSNIECCPLEVLGELCCMIEQVYFYFVLYFLHLRIPRQIKPILNCQSVTKKLSFFFSSRYKRFLLYNSLPKTLKFPVNTRKMSSRFHLKY